MTNVKTVPVMLASQVERHLSARRVVARCRAQIGRRHSLDRKPHDRGCGFQRSQGGHFGRRCGGVDYRSDVHAVGEFVSVSSQRDAEQADIGLEKRELASEPQAELREQAMIYVKRGLEPGLAMKVAEQLSAHDQLGAHMRDELGIDQAFLARPLQAAWSFAASFASFAVVPIAALLVAPRLCASP